MFLAEKRITGVGIEATDELRLLVAASAVTLSLGWPDYEWDQLTEVLLYPEDFDRDYGFDARGAGRARRTPGAPSSSRCPRCTRASRTREDAYHVGLHEFAHLLDVRQTRVRAASRPAFDGSARAGVARCSSRRRRERLRRGKSVIDNYGEESPDEFLAVAVEAFFEIPLALRQRHREVYAILSRVLPAGPGRVGRRAGARAVSGGHVRMAP